MPRTPRAVNQRRTLGRRIRAYRLALGLTSREVAAAIGSSHSQMTSIETVSQDVLVGTLVDVAETVGLHVTLAADHHLPLLDLTAADVQALRDLADRLTADAGWITPALRTALDKLRTSKESTDAH